jgi:hypothetical protein
MSKTEIPSELIGDGVVSRQDLNTTGSSRAVVTKVLVGDLVSESQTGVDTGTGDVTITLTAAAKAAIRLQMFRSFR